MIIPTLVKVLQSLDASQKSLHRKLDTMQANQQTMLKAAQLPVNLMEREKDVDCSPENLRVAMHNNGQGLLETAQVGHQLSSAMYRSTHLGRSGDKTEMEQLKRILESHSWLNKLAGENRAQSARIENAIRVLESKLDQIDKTKPKTKIFRPGES